MSGQHGKTDGLVLGPGDGTSLDFGFSSLRVLLRSEDTDGAFGVTEQPLEPHVLAGPLHIHAHEVGFFYVLEGTIGVQVLVFKGEILGKGEQPAAPPPEVVEREKKPRGKPGARNAAAS